MHEKCLRDPKGIALDCTTLTLGVGGVALALALSWWRRMEKPGLGPSRHRGASGREVGRVSSADTPVGCNSNRRPAATEGAVGVRLWLSEGAVKDNIRVIIGRWQQLTNSKPQRGRLCRSLSPENLGWFRSVASKGSMYDFSAAINLRLLQLLGSQPATR
jgi:hypothetical protein